MSRIILPYPPETRDELWWVMQALFDIKIPRTPVCPDHVTPFQAFADAYFRYCTIPGYEGEFSRAIWLGSRGLAGKSVNLSALSLAYSYLRGADITILGGSMSQSANVHEYMRTALDIDGAPSDMIQDLTATKMVLKNNARVRPLPASQRNVRGPHPSILLCDEIDEMELPIYDAALGQPLPQDNNFGISVDTFTVASSTWQNYDGVVTEVLRRAEEKHEPVYRWCMWESANPVDGWLSQATIDEKRNSVPEDMWRTEYCLGEPAIGNRAFDTDAVEAAFNLKFTPDDPIGSGKGYMQHKEQKDFWEYRFEMPARNGTYVVGVDWAKEKDYTVIVVARVIEDRRRLVYYLRVNRRPYPVMIEYLNKAIEMYHIAHKGAWHDSTGLGNVVNDYLDVRARPFVMTGDKRDKLLSNFVNAIEKGTWDIPRIPAMHTEMKYSQIGDLYKPASPYSSSPTDRGGSSQKFHLPDTVCAAALAEYAATRFTGAAMPVVMKRAGHDTELEQSFGGERRSRRDQELADEKVTGGDVEPEISFTV